MIQYYALRGFHIDDKKWIPFVVVKALAKQEARNLLNDYKESHVKNCSFSDFEISDIGLLSFQTLSGRDDCRAYVTASILKYAAESRKKKRLLQGAP
jgi:hypothetical protein